MLAIRRVKASCVASSRFTRHFSSCGVFRLPKMIGEPFHQYLPGTQERHDLDLACKQIRNSEPVEIPCIVGGNEYFTGDIVEQTMPSDHTKVIARYHCATDALVKNAIEAAAAAKHDWENLPLHDRCMVFRKAADLLAGPRRFSMMATTMLEIGKTVWQAEIDSAVEMIDFWRLNTNFAMDLYSQYQPPLHSEHTWNRSELRALEGFVLAVSPFNFAAIGANLCSSPALMGNTVLWKPAAASVLSNYRSYQILQEAGIPDGVINFLPGEGSVIGNVAINHEDFAGLHFTGSTGTFNKLYQQITNNLDTYKTYPRVVGETGGKNFHFVHKSAEIDCVVNQTLRGAFEYQGQKCSASSRAYIPSNLFAEFKQKIETGRAEMRKLQGQPDDFAASMTAVIDGIAFKKHKAYIQSALDHPDCEVVGGDCDDSIGWFVEPTIIYTKNPQSLTMREEIFGPVLTVYEYPEDEYVETLKLCDSTSEFGLTGSLFARDRQAIAIGERALRHSAGNFYINDKSTGAVVGEQPFGGARASGTNDKAGSGLNLLRWVSARTIKENTLPLDTWKYPYM